MIYWLAPMDWITDCVFRLITQEIFLKYNKKKSDEFWSRSEFMSADWYCHSPNKLVKHICKIIKNPTTQPSEDNTTKFVAQIFGSNIDTLSKTTNYLSKDYDFIDGIELNIWCPAPNIMSCGAGSAMLKDKKNTLEIIKKLSSQTKNFSIKTRTWLDIDDKVSQVDFLLEASNYCKFIWIHGRTYKQSHSWEVDWDFIYSIKSKCNANCKVIWNWWVCEFEDIKRKLWNLDGIMIWQSAIANPWIFVDFVPTKQDIYETTIKHLKLSCAFEIYYKKNILDHNFDRKKIWINYNDLNLEWDEIFDYNENVEKLRTPVEFRKFVFNYVKWIVWNKEFKIDIAKSKDIKEVKNIIDCFF